MNEHIIDRVPNKQRIKEFIDATNSHEELSKYIGRLLEQAYLAGTVKAGCDKTLNHRQHSDTIVGENLVLARNYVKDKGFRL